MHWARRWRTGETRTRETRSKNPSRREKMFASSYACALLRLRYRLRKAPFIFYHLFYFSTFRIHHRKLPVNISPPKKSAEKFLLHFFYPIIVEFDIHEVGANASMSRFGNHLSAKIFSIVRRFRNQLPISITIPIYEDFDIH